MALPRKKILEKIAGKRKAIRYHLNEHIPELFSVTNRDLLRYWHKEVNNHITEMEDWAWQLSKNADILTESTSYRNRLNELVRVRLSQLGEKSL